LEQGLNEKQEKEEKDRIFGGLKKSLF